MSSTPTNLSQPQSAPFKAVEQKQGFKNHNAQEIERIQLICSLACTVFLGLALTFAGVGIGDLSLIITGASLSGGALISLIALHILAIDSRSYPESAHLDTTSDSPPEITMDAVKPETKEQWQAKRRAIGCAYSLIIRTASATSKIKSYEGNDPQILALKAFYHSITPAPVDLSEAKKRESGKYLDKLVNSAIPGLEGEADQIFTDWLKALGIDSAEVRVDKGTVPLERQLSKTQVESQSSLLIRLNPDVKLDQKGFLPEEEELKIGQKTFKITGFIAKETTQNETLWISYIKENELWFRHANIPGSKPERIDYKDIPVATITLIRCST